MTMKIISKQSLAEDAKDRWYHQYRHQIDGTKPSYHNDKRDIYQSLCNITDVTPENVNEAIGNSSWTMLNCNQCSQEVDCVIELGEPEDYESRTVIMCHDCLIEAANKLVMEITK